VEFENLIFHLKQRMNNALPGEDSHKKMKVNFSNNTKLPFSKNKAKPAAVLILLYPNNDKTYFYLTKRADTVKYHKGQINQNPVTNPCLLICIAKRYFNSPATSLFDPIIMLSLFVSNLSEENEVFCFAYSYPQPTVQYCVSPLIAFIFDEFTFFVATP